MLSKKHRITKAEFGRTYASGATFHSPHLILKVVVFGVPNSKFSFTVSRKVVKTAVARNRLRRQGYAALEGELGKAARLLQGVFIFKSGVESLDFGTLRSEIAFLLQKADSAENDRLKKGGK